MMDQENAAGKTPLVIREERRYVGRVESPGKSDPKLIKVIL